MTNSIFGDEISKIKSSKGNRFKLFWNNLTHRIWISLNIQGPHYEYSANNKEDGIKIASEEIEKIENKDKNLKPRYSKFKIRF